jgi:hypothetical protein
LLVFINPFGGKGRGKRVYDRKVAPLFTLASITTDIVSKYQRSRGRFKQSQLFLYSRTRRVQMTGVAFFSPVPGTQRTQQEGKRRKIMGRKFWQEKIQRLNVSEAIPSQVPF